MTMRVLVLEPFSGVSGDMFVAAAAALAECEGEVAALPQKLGLQGVTCVFRDVSRASIRARKFDVMLGSRPAEEIHPHAHHHGTRGDEGHAHRSLAAIRKLILGAGLEKGVATRALRMLDRLGEVEAAVHGVPLEQVHFHEVGAIDSIVDVVASALCIERLGIAGAYSTPVCVGTGTVEGAHGTLPVPAPATERLLQGMPTTTGALAGEWTTPTGALILRELGVGFDIPTLVTLASAFGGGGRDPARRPNVLRLRLADVAEAADGPLRDEVVEIRCNLDDSTGEALGAGFLDTLLQAGARDVVIHPVIMKKGRPGHVLEVLCDPDRAEDLAKLVLAHTSSIGVRMNPVRRVLLPREACRLETEFGSVDAKAVRLPDGGRRIKPEYESCRARAREHGVTVDEIYRAALRAAAAKGSP